MGSVSSLNVNIELIDISCNCGRLTVLESFSQLRFGLRKCMARPGRGPRRDGYGRGMRQGSVVCICLIHDRLPEESLRAWAPAEQAPSPSGSRAGSAPT